VPPQFVRPCVPVTAKTIPRGDGWLHEPKFDGYRMQIVKDGRDVRLYSRRGMDWTKRLPNFAAAFLALPCRAAVFDGELTMPGADGAPSFYRLHSSVPLEPNELAFFAFDLLHRDGNDLVGLPLRDRRRRLERLLARAEIPCLHLVEAFDDGPALFTAAERHGLEGIVSKRVTSAYQSGPSRDWVKVKTAAWRAANRERWRLFEKH
jgi:bifunctional non-homologous end joining protein LigD